MEEFKKHPYLNCIVSNKGKIIGKRGKPLEGSKIRYHRVLVSDKKGVVKTYSAHRLVVETFISLIPPNMTINHKNGVKFDNRVENLEILTQEENTKHALENNLFQKAFGEKNGNSILKEKNVLEIYELIKQNYNNKQIAEKFSISYKTISQIRTGFRWNYLFSKNMKEIIKSNNIKTNTVAQCLIIINEIVTTNKKNIVIAKEFNLEPSLVSRVRSKKTWLEIWKIFDRSATTIPKGSTL